MAHFAKLDKNNIVIQVVTVNNEVLLDKNNEEQENNGISFLKNIYKENDSVWIQTSYNNKFRKKFAGIGDTYDINKDIFIPYCPYKGWIFDENIGKWMPPFKQPITFLTFPKDKEGNLLRNIIFKDDLKIVETKDKDIDYSDNYIWNNNTQNWELPENSIFTEEKQEQFLLINNI
jgi:hypothetical protein